MAEKKNADTAVKATGENKTTPNLRKLSDEDTFAKEFLAHMPDSSKVPDYVHEANKADVVKSALERGLRATGDVELSETKIVDEHNVNLAYTVSVVPNDVKHTK